VNYATSSGTASNANAVNGISGWNYSNRNYNPPYLWATAGSGSDQFLVQPANLAVASANYANSAGSAPANGGTASNSNLFQGRDGSYWLNNADSAVRNIRNQAAANFIAGVAGIGDLWWPVNFSDERLKKDIAPTTVDSLSKIARMRFVGSRWRDDLEFQIGTDDRLHPVGIIAQEAELIEPEWISEAGTWKQPDQYALLMSAMHAIQQLRTQVAELAKLVEK
jgi:hypothetical protein